MIEQDECPHGMEDPSWCSICKHKGELVIDLSGADSEYEFIAKYEGWCGECREEISIGDHCLHLENGRNVHKTCA